MNDKKTNPIYIREYDGGGGMVMSSAIYEGGITHLWGGGGN